jgi:hypothetical protein
MADFIYFAPTIQGSGDGLSWANAKALTAAALNAAVAEVGPGGRVYLRGNPGDDYAIAAAIQLTSGGNERAPVIIQMMQSDGQAPHETAWLTGTRQAWTPPTDLEQTTDVSTWDAAGQSIFWLAGANWLTFNALRMRNVGQYAFTFTTHVTGLTINDFTGFNVRRLLWDTVGVRRLRVNRANVLGYSASFIRIDKPTSQDIEIIGPSEFDSRYQINDAAQVARALSLNAGKDITVEGITGYRGGVQSGNRADGVYLEQDVVNLTMRNCAMHGFTNGGFTITFNGRDTFENLTATDNARNFIFGGSAGGILPGLVSRSPNLRGATAPARHIDMAGNTGAIDVSGGVFTGGGTLVVMAYSTQTNWHAEQYLDLPQVATGSVPRLGSAAQTLAAITQVATGRYRATGSAAHDGAVNGAMEFVQLCEGTVIVNGNRAQTLPALTQVAYSGTPVAGPVQSSARQFIEIPQAFVGTLGSLASVTGTAAQTLAVPSTGTGKGIVAGNRAQPAFVISQVAAGTAPVVPNQGAASQVIGIITQTATGQVVQPARSGSAAQTLAALSQSASGKAIARAQAAQAAFAITQVATGLANTLPTLVQTAYPVNFRTTDTTAAYTTASFTPPNRSLLVAVISGGVPDGSADSAFTITDTQFLKWTRRATARDSEAKVEIWTAPVLTGAAMTVTVDHASTLGQTTVQIVAYEGYDMANPIGASVVSTTIAFDGAVSLTLPTAPESTSYVLAAYGHSTAGSGNSVSPGAGWTEICDTNDSSSTSQGWGGLQVQHRTGSTSATVAWTDANVLGNTNDWGSVAIALEIRRSTVAYDAPSGAIWTTMVDPVGHSRDIPVAWGSYAAGPGGYALWRPTLARQPWSMYAPSKTQANIQVRSGDLYSEPDWTDPTTSERSELQLIPLLPAANTVSFEWWDLLNGPTNTAPWCTLVQFFARDAGGGGLGSPPLGIYLESPGNTLQVITRTDASGSVVESYRYTVNNYPRDTWKKLKVELKFSRTGTGVLRLWIDDVQVVNLTSINVGYATQTQWELACGVYRSEAAETLEHRMDSPIITVT